MNGSDFSEAFMKANANRQFIAHQMADVLRELLRSISSDDDSGYKASEKMQFVGELLARCEEALSWWDLFSDALKILRENISENGFDDDWLWAAQRGMKFFAESTSDDPAARARASRRRSEFRSSITETCR